MLEVQNLNNIFEDPDFIKHGKILRESYKSPKTELFENSIYTSDMNEIEKIK